MAAVRGANILFDSDQSKWQENKERRKKREQSSMIENVRFGPKSWQRTITGARVAPSSLGSRVASPRANT